MQKITPFIWFDDQAEEAVNFYTSLFKDSKMGEVSRYGEAGPLPAGTVMTLSFELMGTEFTALNGGPEFRFSPAVSFFVHCQTQEEVDKYWEKLSEGVEEQPCGWVTDRFGITWQVIPDALMDFIQGDDPAAAQRATQAMFQMKKIDLEVIRAAYEQD